MPAGVERRVQPAPIEFEVELITPLLGGGAKPRETDSISWLRSASAKSAIRTWWRIGFAHRFHSPQEMKKREDLLFGARAEYDKTGTVVNGPGMLSVRVKADKIPTKRYSEPVESALNSAYFPAAVGKIKAELGVTKQTAKVALHFDRRLGCDVAQADIDEIKFAAKLWLTFGGVGGRTRRSAGALATSEATAKDLGLPRTTAELTAFVVDSCRRLPIAAKMDSIFCLARTRNVFVGKEYDDEKEAHKKLLEPLREGRQDRKHPPDWKTGDFGQSRWPEADAIRLKAARTADGSEWSHKPIKTHAGRYPRAALGLPIVVYFMKRDDTEREPAKHHIYAAQRGVQSWEKINRYASPILLRVVRVWRDGKAKYVPIAIFTDCTLPQNLRPLVTIGESDSVHPRDVVETYSIRENADRTLSCIEAKYNTQDFHKI